MKSLTIAPCASNGDIRLAAPPINAIRRDSFQESMKEMKSRSNTRTPIIKSN